MIRFHSDCSEVLLRNLFATVMRPRQTLHRTSRKLLMLRTLLEKRTVLTAPGPAVALAPPYFSSLGMLETNPPIQHIQTAAACSWCVQQMCVSACLYTCVHWQMERQAGQFLGAKQADAGHRYIPARGALPGLATGLANQ